jgi:chromosome segregation protein
MRVEQLNRDLLKSQEEAARLTSERAVAEERARQLKARHEEVLAELEPLSVQREEQLDRVDQALAQVEQFQLELAERKTHVVELEREWAAVQERERQPARKRVHLERELQAHRARLGRLNEDFLDARADAAHLSGELEALKCVRDTGVAYDAGVQALRQSAPDSFVGPLAALIRVTPEWECAVEAALSSDLRAIVVRRGAVVREIGVLVESAGGGLTLVPLDGLRPIPPLPPEALCAGDVVTCGEDVRPAVETLLGAVALCEDLAAAQALLPAMPPGSRCVTTEGVVLRADGVLSVGQTGAESVLADERTRRELPAQLDEVRRRCEKIEDQQHVEAKQIAELEAELEELARQAERAREEAARVEREALRQAHTRVAVAEEALRNQQSALRRENSLLERIEAQMQALRQQACNLESEHIAFIAPGQDVGEHSAGPVKTETQIDVQLEKVRQRCEEIKAQQTGETKQIAALEARLESLAEREAEVKEEAARVERETVGKARTEVAVVEEALRNQRATLQRETSLLDRLQAQVAARYQRAEELESEHAAIVARAQNLRVQASQLEAQLRLVRARIQPAEEKLTQSQEEQDALERQEVRARERVRDMEARYSQAQLDVSRSRDELKLLARRIEEDLGLVELDLSASVTAQTPLPLRPMVSLLPVVEELPEGLEEEIQRLKARLRRLGAVNPNAPAEYVEVQERHRFLTEQAADLEKASAQLRHVVAELDELMEAAFQRTFDAVAKEFSEIFKTLFDGGNARLELTEPDDLMNTGVDIVARPPGKRPQRLALLSGGERALTAVALLFAILRVSPAPFCVLDEVDAMLDEANLGRFRVLLKELSQQTQFVIITHSRATVEAADTIYGISMGADAVSQVVSLKLDEVEAGG